MNKPNNGGGVNGDCSSPPSLLVAYVLWASLGFTGAHHAYLDRPRQALGWYATVGFFGFGWLRDAWLMPYYVALARDDCAAGVAAKIRAATVEARCGVPSLSVLRTATMTVFAWYFGKIAICLLSLPDGKRWSEAVYAALQTIGSAAGVWLVGNMGEEIMLRRGTGVEGSAMGIWVRLTVACLASFSLLGSPILGGIAYAWRCRRYRHSMRPKTSLSRRIIRHLLACAMFTALLTLAIYNHGGIVVNGEKVFVHEAIRNARNSKFWQEFDFSEFQARFHESSGQGSGDYLKKLFDLEGERSARRTLGVPLDATHSEVRSAYKKLALKYHPDKIRADALESEVDEYSRRFVRVQEAYEVLNKIEQRRKKKAGSGQSEGLGGGGNENGDERMQGGQEREEM